MNTGASSYQNNSYCARLRIEIRSVWRIHRMLVEIQDLTPNILDSKHPHANSVVSVIVS